MRNESLVNLGKLRNISDSAYLSIRGTRWKTIIPKAVIIERDIDSGNYYWIKDWFLSKIEDVEIKSRR